MNKPRAVEDYICMHWWTIIKDNQAILFCIAYLQPVNQW